MPSEKTGNKNHFLDLVVFVVFLVELSAGRALALVAFGMVTAEALVPVTLPAPVLGAVACEAFEVVFRVVFASFLSFVEVVLVVFDTVVVVAGTKSLF